MGIHLKSEELETRLKQNRVLNGDTILYIMQVWDARKMLFKNVDFIKRNQPKILEIDSVLEDTHLSLIHI